MNNHKDRTNNISPSSKVQLSITHHQSKCLKLLFVVVKHRVTTKLTKSKTIPVHRERRTQYSVIAVHLRRGQDEIQMTQG